MLRIARLSPPDSEPVRISAGQIVMPVDSPTSINLTAASMRSLAE